MVVYCILFIWRTNFLNEQRRIRGHLNDNVTTATSTSKGGLDLKVIETIPVIVYSDIKNKKKIHSNERVVECAVCLGEYEDEDMLRLLPTCRHFFHCHCIDAWFISHSTCPVCRSNIEVMAPEAALNSGGTVLDVFEDDGNHSESTMTVINVSAEQTHVSVSVAESSEQATDNLNLKKEMNPNQTTGRSVNPSEGLSKSHSTGHSLVPENSETYTLGSPDDVRKASVNGKLNRYKRGVTFTI
ncbi:E3 ubiquitin-protein ligase ATL6-like [Papaver somniferum]|uniref:E3 ubiquitin-protein ligase ATL6-like n=1 Tax=Papaver somniferum TaxID=3469 RepID=UPI000E6FB119|nr:E3 ubiquitin-protein ligase ATL6-like [Papaver somniferum]